jgi:SSS family solute:Na+ symporter
MLAAIVVYIAVSFLQKKEFNMDQLLHRGRYAIKGESTEGEAKHPVKGFGAFFTEDHTIRDKIIYGILLAWIGIWTLVFLAATAYNIFIGEIPNTVWSKFWHFKVILATIIAMITAIWFLIGGLKDVKEMFKRLRNAKRNYLDSGMVDDHRNLGEEELQHYEK